MRVRRGLRPGLGGSIIHPTPKGIQQTTNPEQQSSDQSQHYYKDFRQTHNK
jgi:hypothetical protein